MLGYETQLLLDIHGYDESQLFIFARGIEIQQVLVNLFRIYGTETNLVFVLCASPSEEAYFLRTKGGTRLLSITNEFQAKERKELYASGGVFFITGRILVVDFLKDVVPAEKITGMIIFRAHNIVESSQEAFILRLYRTKNKTGFIKCFSHSPTSFLLGFSRITTVMRSSFLAKVSLWPRFHAALKESLSIEQDTDSVVEIHLNLTEEMREIQSSLMDLVSATLSELKRYVSALNDEEVTVDTALSKGFEKLIRSYVDPVWNTIDHKAKEAMNDLKVFRLLLTHLTKSDCVTFYSILCNYTSHEAAMKPGSGWVFSKAAEKIVVASRKRLKPTETITTPKKAKVPSDKSDSTISSGPTFDPEVHPKWLAVSEILQEIHSAVKNAEESTDEEDPCFLSKARTIIFAEDSRTCKAIRSYLSHGRILAMARIVRYCDNFKMELPSDVVESLNEIRHEEELDLAVVGWNNFNSKSDREGDTDDFLHTAFTPSDEVEISFTQIERNNDEIEFIQSPVLVLPLKYFGEGQAYAISETLERLRPTHIIIFDPDLELIRNIEIYRARRGLGHPIKIYFLVFRNSIEEQIYLTGIQREKMAFEKLIEEKTTMVIPNEREGKDEVNQDLWRDPSKANEAALSTMQSKRNMENVDEEHHSVLVDMREFRSELPSLIHKRGIELEPLTLDVGDYILTPDICVERKSVSDLIGSLNSGRLYKQAEAMSRHYKKPVLLIEHEQKFGTGRYKNDLAQVMPKLQLLTISFPKLRIIWSPGAHYTSEIFHELKRGKPQPESEKALTVLKESVGSHSTSKFNPQSHGFLSKMPGIDSKNVYTILNRFDSIPEISKLSVEELAIHVENSRTANLLYSGFHSKLLVEHSETKDTRPKTLYKSNYSKVVSTKWK